MDFSAVSIVDVTVKLIEFVLNVFGTAFSHPRFNFRRDLIGSFPSKCAARFQVVRQIVLRLIFSIKFISAVSRLVPVSKLLVMLVSLFALKVRLVATGSFRLIMVLISEHLFIRNRQVKSSSILRFGLFFLFN